MKLSDFLVRDAIIIDLASTTRDGAIREIVQGFLGAGQLVGQSPDDLTAVLLEREKLGSTGIGRGVAVPHAKLPFLRRVIGSIALAPHGVEFHTIDGKPVDVFFSLFNPSADLRTSLLACEAAARRLSDEGFLARLRQCRTREEVFDLVVETDEEAAGAAEPSK